ncbi:MAG: PAS domain-containing protein [Candidatus Thermoplasmatota archaeon]|nr:PAS domain-containing protein [Candidatus Thermoplasmatota archaeon]
MIGSLPKDIIEALFETIPMEVSVLDKNDNVLAWNKHETRIFKRPESVVGRDVRKCHPKKSLDKVEKIIGEMKAGKREKATFWIDLCLEGKKDPHKIFIQYLALRNNEGKYVGCLEATQDITDIQKISGEKRLLDMK